MADPGCLLNPHISYILPFPDSTWIMVAKLDSADVFAEIRSLAVYVLIIVALAILATLKVAWGVISQQKARVKELNLEVRKSEEK